MDEIRALYAGNSPHEPSESETALIVFYDPSGGFATGGGWVQSPAGADLDDPKFRSIEMEWLVVTGEARAQFRGTGVLNGETVCRFQVDAWDGSKDGADAFGIHITACEGGGGRYRLEATELGGGNIRIQT